MSLPIKFLALSAVYFGLASAVTLPTAAVAQSGRTPTGQASEADRAEPRRSPPQSEMRQREFQHPMLESPRSTDPRHGNTSIHRRGDPNLKRDGMMERHGPTDFGNSPPKDARKPLNAPDR